MTQADGIFGLVRFGDIPRTVGHKEEENRTFGIRTEGKTEGEPVSCKVFFGPPSV